MKKIIYFTLATLIIATSIGWWPTFGFQNPPSETFEFNEMPQSSWDFYVNGKGEIQPPPFHVGEAYTQNGLLTFSVAPDPDFDKRSRVRKEGQAAKEVYENVFGMMRTEYSPTISENVLVTSRFRIPTGNGTGGMWTESSEDFDQEGILNSWGFRGAVGISYTGDESSDIVDGLRFMYVVSFAPICNVKIEGVDVTQWHEYSILWEKTVIGHSYTLSIDGVEEAKCNIPFIGFHKSNLQLWRDNYLIREGHFWILKWPTVDHQNFDEIQSIEYDWVSIEAVEK